MLLLVPLSVRQRWSEACSSLQEGLVPCTGLRATWGLGGGCVGTTRIHTPCLLCAANAELPFSSRCVNSSCLPAQWPWLSNRPVWGVVWEGAGGLWGPTGAVGAPALRGEHSQRGGVCPPAVVDKSQSAHFGFTWQKWAQLALWCSHLSNLSEQKYFFLLVLVPVYLQTPELCIPFLQGLCFVTAKNHWKPHANCQGISIY